MAKFAIYTLTRDRLEYTQHCFQTLWNNAGQDFDHFVIDNGSGDDTYEWLVSNRDRFRWISQFKHNMGIASASNAALDFINACEEKDNPYDFIVKFDNDCEVISQDILPRITEAFSLLAKGSEDYAAGKFILSPFVGGLNRQPRRSYTLTLGGGYTVGVTGIIGGIFHVVPAKHYQRFRYPTNYPKASGNDSRFCEWNRQQGWRCGYVEELKVNHYESTEGQARRFPEYFTRKKVEEVEMDLGSISLGPHIPMAPTVLADGRIMENPR